MLSRHRTKDELIYYALVLPAIVAEAVFLISIATTPGGLVVEAGPLGGAAAWILPLAVMAASLYAVYSFRPSLLVSLLTVSFILVASVKNGLGLGDSVVLVVATAFFALAGFNYARGVKLLGDRRPVMSSSGPVGYNVLGIAVDFAVPLAAAVALVLLVEAVVAAVTTQAALLPAPLSTLASLYFQTRIGLVFATLFVAGATIWVIRQFIEPVILYFTLSAGDARRELLSEVAPTIKSVRRISRYIPSRGLSWGVLGVTYCLGVIAVLAIFLPWAQVSRDLVGALTLQAPSPTYAEILLQDNLHKAILDADTYFARSQDYVRDIIRLLWG